MNAMPRFPYNEPERHLLTLAKWARQSEEATLRRLYGTYDAPAVIDEDGDGGLPPLPADDLAEEEAADRAAGREWL